MTRLYAIGVSLTLASVAWAGNVRSCYTGQVSFSIVDPNDGKMCGDGSGGKMKSESCSTGICGHYEYEDEQCVYMVGFCSHATTVTECEDSIRLEREDEDVPAAMLARRLGSQQSSQVIRRVACCESTDCNAKALSPKSTRKLFADRSNRKLLGRRLKKKSSFKFKSKSYKSKSYKVKYSGGSYHSGGSYRNYYGGGHVYYSDDPAGAIAGAIVGALLFLGFIGIFIFYMLRRKQRIQVAVMRQQHQTAAQVQALYRGRKARVQYANRVNNVQYVQVHAQPMAVSGAPVQVQAQVVHAQVQHVTAAGVQPMVIQPVNTAGVQPMVIQPVNTAGVQPTVVQPIVVQPTL